MTLTMMFDGTAAGGDGRFPPLGEIWARFLRTWLGFLRAERGTAGGGAPNDSGDHPAAAMAAAEPAEGRSLRSAYAVDFRPSYEPLLRPDPEPTDQPPDEPDPPPSGYSALGDRKEPLWPFYVLRVLRGIFGDTPPPTIDRKA